MRLNFNNTRSSIQPLAVAIILLCALFGGLHSAQAQGINDVPEAGQGIEVDEAGHIGTIVPSKIRFNDEDNNVVTLDDYLHRGRPVMLSFNYSNCPKLCHTQLTNMAFTLRDIGLVPGRDFEIVSISIDPNEQAAKARETKEKYLTIYNRPETANGWHFLTGKRSNIKRQADSVGVNYRYIPESKSYSHSAVFIMLSPDGKAVRYIYGLEVEPKVLELALTEAGEGKIGSPINKGFLLTGCFVYDQFTGQYTMQWMGLMRIAGVLTAYGVFVWLIPGWLRVYVLYVTGIFLWLGVAALFLLSKDHFTFVMICFVGSPFFVFATVLLGMKIRSAKKKLNEFSGDAANELNLATSGEQDV